MNIVVLGRKYDGKPHYEYPVELLHSVRPWVGAAVPGSRTIHHSGGFALPPSHGFGLFWFPAGAHDIITWIFSTEGHRRLVRCDVATPAQLVDGRIEYVDLDLDVIAAYGRPTVLEDRDEFEAHRSQYGYTDELVAQANRAAEELMELSAAGRFPFDVQRPGDVVRHCFDDSTAAGIRAAITRLPW